jgi:hypothetical protein
MLRIFAILLALTSSAFAQVATPDESLQEQLVPESFKLTATASATRPDLTWMTAVSYALVNNAGMNLYMGLIQGSAAIGSCTEIAAATGGLPTLPSPNQMFYVAPIGAGPPRGLYVPAGGRVAGTITFLECSAPNPGYPTAPLSMSLMVGKSNATKTMIQFPLSADVPIRKIQ